MFRAKLGWAHLSSDEWKSVTIGERDRLFRVHNFHFMFNGRNFNIQIEESSQGDYIAHADDTMDSAISFKSVTGTSMKACLDEIVQQIKDRAVARI